MIVRAEGPVAAVVAAVVAVAAAAEVVVDMVHETGGNQREADLWDQDWPDGRAVGGRLG